MAKAAWEGEMGSRRAVQGGGVAQAAVGRREVRKVGGEMAAVGWEED